MSVYLAAHHAGFEMKNVLIDFVRDELNYKVEDCGAHEFDASDDYPLILKKAAERLASDVARGVESFAIVCGGSDQGEAVAMNRHKGVRCGVFYGWDEALQPDTTGNEYSLLESMRAHDDTNALALASRMLSLDSAKEAVRTWLGAHIDVDERHKRRIDQLDQLG